MRPYLEEATYNILLDFVLEIFARDMVDAPRVPAPEAPV